MAARIHPITAPFRRLTTADALRVLHAEGLPCSEKEAAELLELARKIARGLIVHSERPS